MVDMGKAYYNGQELTFELPEEWNLLAMAEPQDVAPAGSIATEVRRALNDPTGMEGLAKLVSPATKRVALISEDQTRPSPVGLVMLPLIEELNGLGVDDGKIDVVVGRGTHREPTEDELRAKLGEEILRRFRVSVHNADSEDLTFVGSTSRGTPCWSNRIVAEADLKIAVGTINPHYFAGYGGGPKIMLPGVSGRESIKANHILIRDPNTVQGRLDGNPIWEDMLEAARLMGLDMKMDLVLNAQGQIYGVFAGEVEQAQKAAIEAFIEIYGVPIPQMVDVVITSGYPLEVNLIQSCKAIMSAEPVTKPGGTIVLVSACSDGAGPGFYETLRERPAPEEVIDWIAAGKASPTGGPMASMLRALLASKGLLVVTEGLTQAQLEDMEMGYAPSVAEAIGQVVARHNGADVAVLPVGSASFPYVVK